MWRLVLIRNLITNYKVSKLTTTQRSEMVSSRLVITYVFSKNEAIHVLGLFVCREIAD